MPPEELRTRLAAREPLEVVDIREEEDWEDWHIRGSRNVPVYEDLRREHDDGLIEASQALSRDRPVVTVCKAGVVSQRAASVLERLGFDAASLAGGMRGWGAVWSEAPVPLEGALCIQVRRNGKGCLSYLIGSDGEAVVVDPSVDAAVYERLAAREGLRIVKVLETHVHADHLSRARELAQRQQAELWMPANDRVRFDHRQVHDGDALTVGALRLEALATPGHTGESTCYVAGGALLLTGDTLFTEGIGRPDLERGDAGATEGARRLWRSLHRRILELPGHLRVLPAHHGEPVGFDGEPVAAPLAALRDELAPKLADEDAFVQHIVGSLGSKPPNFEEVIAVNEGKAELGRRDPLELEAGPNRCAAG